MSTAENKIKFGLSRVYYALATIAADGTATYGNPKAFPGAVSLSLDPQGENTPFYADNIVYWMGVGNTGYQGDLEMAMITDTVLKDIFGYKEGGNGLLYEDAAATAVHFALLFQVEGDVSGSRHVFYNCTATRPNTGGSTKQETVEPQTETITLTATTVHVAALDADIVKAKKTSTGDSDTVYSGWFTAVTTPTAVAATT